MKGVFLFVGVGSLVLVGLLFFLRSDGSTIDIPDFSDEQIVRVVLTENGFEPNHFRIKKGTEVVFSTDLDNPFWPASNIHPSHSIYSAFDPREPIESDKTWSFVFDEAGEWGFHDHVRSYYTGIIQVIE